LLAVIVGVALYASLANGSGVAPIALAPAGNPPPGSSSSPSPSGSPPTGSSPSGSPPTRPFPSGSSPSPNPSSSTFPTVTGGAAPTSPTTPSPGTYPGSFNNQNVSFVNMYTHVTGLLRYVGYPFTSATINLVSIGNELNFNLNANLTLVNFPNLATVGDFVTFFNNALLVGINLPQLTSASAIQVYNNPVLTYLSLPILQSVTQGFQICANGPQFVIPASIPAIWSGLACEVANGTTRVPVHTLDVDSPAPLSFLPPPRFPRFITETSITPM